ANLTNTVDAGEVDFGITGVGAALANAKLDYVGPLPAAIQAYVNLAAGVCANAREPQAARALLKYLRDPVVLQIMKSKGLEPYCESPSRPRGFRCYGLSFWPGGGK